MGVVKDADVARRIARAVVSDIALYNAKKVEEGVRNDTLFDLLKEEIKEGQGYYLSRVDPEIARSTNYFDQALVDVLLKPAGHIPSKIW
jgi:EAL domain-containing protein (putative c-di-GMP-specific phosphodiesterase class I)